MDVGRALRIAKSSGSLTHLSASTRSETRTSSFTLNTALAPLAVNPTNPQAKFSSR
jgi:hypothetical protein